jgi:DNA-binding transcriptional LysR family regulator
MELRQLRYLLALAQELSFTNAAAKTHVAQPALSRQIRKLEDHLGVALVDRTSRRVQLTAAGHRLADHAQLILDDVEKARADILQIADLSSGRLAIGTTQTPGPLNVLHLLATFHALHPAIELAVREELSASIADMLRADEIDLGFVSEIPEGARHGLDMQLLASEPLVVALPAGHRLACEGVVDFGALQSESFVLFPEGATVRSTFDRLALQHAIDPHIAFVTSDANRMRELVALGLGIGLLPESDANRKGHSSVRIRGESLNYRVYLARRRSRRRSPSAAAMTRLIEAELTSVGASQSV